MYVLVVDDEKRARESIIEMLKLYCPQVDRIEQAESIKTAEQTILNGRPDLILLDIKLKDGSGFDLIAKIKHFDIPVIFITAYEEYALKAFEIAALHYLLKPIDPDALVAALEKAEQILQKNQLQNRLELFLDQMATPQKATDKIVLKTQENIYIVPIKEIIYCEADKNYTTFFIKGKNKIVVSKSIGEYESLLPGSSFLRIHQSILLNLGFIDRYERGDGGFVVTTEGNKVPVSTRKKDQLMAYLSGL
ncbi:MAG: LytTR family DNA-binding domain-containing protein [Flavobacteriales bacterium]